MLGKNMGMTRGYSDENFTPDLFWRGLWIYSENIQPLMEASGCLCGIWMLVRIWLLATSWLDLFL